MKKALSLLLAILMIFSVLSVGTFATSGTEGEGADPTSTSTIRDILIEANVMSADDCILKFYVGSGEFMGDQRVFDYAERRFVSKSPEQLKTIGDPYVKYPEQPGTQKPGSTVALPLVKAPTGYAFNGWHCVDDNSTAVAGVSGWTIPENFRTVSGGVGESTAGKVITFRAIYVPADVEEPVFNKVFDILAKIFGTIIGLIAYEGDTNAGIAFVRKIFSGITE